MSYFRDNVERMAAYVPGEQPAVGAEVIKLNTNENPYPPSPAAMAVLREFQGERLRLYPRPMADAFRAAAAKLHGVPGDWVLTGNGSDDLLTMIAYSCFERGRSVAYPVPTFTYYRTLADIQQAEAREVPFDDDFNLPIDGLSAAAAEVTFVASPNSPSGTGYSAEELDDLAGRLDGLLVIDEAYADFAEADAIGLAGSRENVIVLRTLSKGYSLAGLRAGYAVARPELLGGLGKVKGIYNVGAAGSLVAAAALADQSYKIACADKVKASRARLAATLAKLGWRVWPSQANFLLARPPAGDAGRIHGGLKARGILVRYFKQPDLQDKLRITVGTDRQNDELGKALTDLTGQP